MQFRTGSNSIIYPAELLLLMAKYTLSTVNTSLKVKYDIQQQVKSLYCATSKFRGAFVQCSGLY